MTTPTTGPFCQATPDTSPNADGQAHVAYYAGHTSFVWNGGDRVAVCRGGYGEPVDHVIPAAEDLKDLSTRVAMTPVVLR